MNGDIQLKLNDFNFNCIKSILSTCGNIRNISTFTCHYIISTYKNKEKLLLAQHIDLAHFHRLECRPMTLRCDTGTEVSVHAQGDLGKMRL